MRKSVSLFACGFVILFHSLVVLPQKPINHGGKIEAKYDGIAFETVMKLRKMKVTCEGSKDNFKEACVSIEMALHCPGTQVSHVGSVSLQLIFETADWNHAHGPNQRELALVADAATMHLGKMRLVPTSSEWSEKMVETLETTISYDVFKKMIASQSVEMQVGPSIVALRDKNLLALRDLDNRVITTK